MQGGGPPGCRMELSQARRGGPVKLRGPSQNGRRGAVGHGWIQRRSQGSRAAPPVLCLEPTQGSRFTPAARQP